MAAAVSDLRTSSGTLDIRAPSLGALQIQRHLSKESLTWRVAPNDILPAHKYMYSQLLWVILIISHQISARYTYLPHARLHWHISDFKRHIYAAPAGI
eukprot:scaffold36155_cov17-Prasinocladus_malaysianus.AAC.1